MKAYRISGTAPFGSQRQPFSYDVMRKTTMLQPTRSTPFGLSPPRRDGASRLRASMKLTANVHRTRDSPSLPRRVAAQGGLISSAAEEE